MDKKEELLPVCLDFISMLEAFNMKRLKLLNECCPTYNFSVTEIGKKSFLLVALQERLLKKLLFDLKKSMGVFSGINRYNLYPATLYKSMDIVLDRTYSIFNGGYENFNEYAGLCLLPDTVSENKEVVQNTIEVVLEREDMEYFISESIVENYFNLNKVWFIDEVLENIELEFDNELFLNNGEYRKFMISNDEFLKILTSQIIEYCDLSVFFIDLFIDNNSYTKAQSDFLCSLNFSDILTEYNISISDLEKSSVHNLFSYLCDTDFHYVSSFTYLNILNFPLIKNYYSSKREGIRNCLDEKIDFLLMQLEQCLKSSEAYFYHNLESGTVVLCFYDYPDNKVSLSEMHVPVMFNVYLQLINTLIKLRFS